MDDPLLIRGGAVVQNDWAVVDGGVQPNSCTADPASVSERRDPHCEVLQADDGRDPKGGFCEDLAVEVLIHSAAGLGGRKGGPCGQFLQVKKATTTKTLTYVHIYALKMPSNIYIYIYIYMYICIYIYWMAF
jgi:hypothetical protein